MVDGSLWTIRLNSWQYNAKVIYGNIPGNLVISASGNILVPSLAFVFSKRNFDNLLTMQNELKVFGEIKSNQLRSGILMLV